jgi:nitroreductase
MTAQVWMPLREDLKQARFTVNCAGSWVVPPTRGLCKSSAPPLASICKLNDVPAIIFVCGPVAYPPNAPMEQFVWSALYPAAQNLIVAARSLGLGTTFTTFHMFMEASYGSCWEFPKR